MTPTLLAIATYGSQRVKHPRTLHTVSAYKLGYTGAGRAVLLALLKDHAQDVTSAQASYHYVQITGDVSVRHGYILLKVNDNELTRAESLTTKVQRPAVYRWMSDAWHEMPSSRSPQYTPLAYRTGPDFNPTSLLIPTTDGQKQAAANGVITVEQSQRDGERQSWWWLHGDTYPHRELLKQWGGRWSQTRKAWYFIAAALPTAIQQLIDAQPATLESDDAPCSDEEAERILGVRLAPKPSAPLPEEPADKLAVQVIAPAALPVEVAQAVKQMTVSPSLNRPRNSQLSIPQQLCGELTGSITGNVFCYGYAVHEGVLIYLNFGGPRMAVEAIRARLVKGNTVNLIPPDAAAIELTAGEGNTGMYTAFTQNLPEAKFTSMILIHQQVTQPNYGGKSTTFILRLDDGQAAAKLKAHVTTLVNVPVFDPWCDYLYQAGQAAQLVRKTRGSGLDVLAVDLDVDAWTRLITGGLANGVIQLTETRKHDASD